MINLRSLPLCVLASAFFVSAAALAQQAAAPAVRILNPVDESQLVTLSHTVHPLANSANDRGAAPDGMQLDRLQLVLQRSPAQESALRSLIAQMNTPGTPSYHQWLSPDQFGAQFGTSDQDIATIESWLSSHGFAISRVNAGKGTLEFSGSVAQLREAFHTQIHRYVVNGQTHYANATDPQIPAALAPVIGGFSQLNNFHPTSYLRKLGTASFNPATHQATPSWTWSNNGGVDFVVAPGDFSKEYDLTPLYTANVNGTGQTIAIINDSNVNVDLVNQFRTLFSLPVNPPQVIIDGNDPGVDGINDPDGPNYDSTEAYLDVEWSGAVAPNATIDLVIAADTSLETGLILAMEHAVYGNVAPVISLSFGQCEASLGSTNSFLNSLWEQAAAQGQTAMVSAGDNGSAGCDDDDSQEYATDGQQVSGFASTPYNVAVGGTDFYYSSYATPSALTTQLGTYWTTTPTTSPAVSLLQYIPEQPWNDSQYGLNAYNEYATYGTTTIAGGSGGASNAALCSSSYSATTGACTGTLTGYPKPSWQTGAGVPNDNVRDLPDVSLFSANGDNYSFYPICASDGDCQTSSNPVQISGVGGTSASSPSFAGIMALVVEKWGRQGQADNILYALKTQYPSAFHDVLQGSNSMPCEILPTATPNCISVTGPAVVDGITEGQIGSAGVAEYNAAAGYNLATGLGTIDANNLITDWPKVVLTSSATTLTPSSASFAHGTTITISGSVTGTNTPTGNVALMTDSTEPLQQGQGVFPLTSGAYSNASVNYLPGGTYHIWGQYSGDAKNAMSTSAPPVQITVTPETPGMNLNLFNQALGQYYTSGSNPGTQVDYGSQLMISSQVAPTSQLANLQNCEINGTNCSGLIYTEPTGTVTFTDNGNTVNTAIMNAEGDAEYNAPFAVGTHSVNATYNGDQSYNKITASAAIPFTVIKDSPVIGWAASNLDSASQIISGQPTVMNVIVENGAQYGVYTGTSGAAISPVPVLPPTGTVVITSSPSGISGTVPLSAGVDPTSGGEAGIGTLTLPSTLASNTYTVNFTYSGDSNYEGNSGTPVQYSIQVVTGGGTATVTTASTTGAISPNSTITVTGSVTGSSAHGAPTGGVIVFSSLNYLTGSSYLPFSGTSGNASLFSFALSSQALVQGANFVTIQYIGDANYATSEFTLSGGAAIQNPLADFSLVPDTTIVPVTAGGSGTDTINVSSVNGFTGVVNLTCAATTPVTCGITPNPTLSNQSSSTSTLTINVPAGTANGNYNVAVTGKDPTGEFIHTLAVTADVTGSTPAITLTNSGNITVAQAATTGNTSTITVTPSAGFTGNVALTCAVTTAPVGATDPTCTLTPPSVDITSTGALTSVLAVNTTLTTTPGAYVITVTGTSGSLTSTTTVGVTVTLPQDFAITNSGNITVNAGATTGNTSTITVTPSGGFSSAVALTCAVTTAPTGATDPTCALNPTSVTPPGTTTSVLTVTSTGTTPGAYVITVTGTAAGPDVHTTTVSVTVNAAGAASYTVTAGAPSPSTISPGSSSATTITVTGSGGYPGSVTLTCALTSGSPVALSGVTDPPTCTMTGSPVSLSSSNPGSATATVNTTAATADLIYPKVANGKGWLGAGSGALIAMLFFFGIPAKRRTWRSMLGILVALVALGALSSCGGSGSSGGGGTNPSNPGTTADAYTFTITSSGNPSVSSPPTTTFTVSVN